MINENLYYQIELTARRIRQYGQSVLRQHGIDITIEQWLVIKVVAENEGMNQLTIGEMLYKDKPTISRMVKSLEQKGYIQKSPSPTDLRAAIIEISPKGLKLVEQLLPHIKSIRAKGLAVLDEVEKKTLSHLLLKIRTAIES